MDSAKLAEIALSLCSSAPHDFGGIVFKNASETHTSHIRSLFKSGEINATVLQPFCTLKDLTGGIDAISTMSSGKLVEQPGLLEKPGWFIQVMGERLPLENQAVMCKRIDEKKIGPVLILDEPTVGLDPRTERELLSTIFHSTTSKTLVWVTHHLVGAEHMDEIIFMEQGKIIMQGSHADLMEREPRYRHLYELDSPQ